MRRVFKSLNVSLSLMIILSFTVNLQSVYADRGLVGPPEISLEEPGQIAIIAWNGQEEVLILSTNVRSSKPTSVLEILPLPSNPTEIVEGSFDSFRKIAELVNEEIMVTKNIFELARVPDGGWGLEITFQEKIGSHDLTIVKLNSQDHFAEWVSNFAESRHLEFSVSNDFIEMVSLYLNQEIRFFVFDVIEINTIEKSVEPLVYKFKTDFLYYPLKITAISTSEEVYSTVNLFLIAKGQVDGTSLSEMNFVLRSGFTRYLELNNQQLYEISPELSDLFEGDPLVMNLFYHGSLKHLYGDIMIQMKDLHMPTIFELFSQRVSDTFFYSYLESSIREYQWLPIHRQILAITFIFSLLVGIPSTIYLTAKLTRRAIDKTYLKMWTRKLISYSLAILVIVLLIFTNIEGVTLVTIVAFTFVGFAVITHQILKIVRKL
jgi:hypothetical protein